MNNVNDVYYTVELNDWFSIDLLIPNLVQERVAKAIETSPYGVTNIPITRTETCDGCTIWAKVVNGSLYGYSIFYVEGEYIKARKNSASAEKWIKTGTVAEEQFSFRTLAQAVKYLQSFAPVYEK